jgi:hypothetical protein
MSSPVIRDGLAVDEPIAPHVGAAERGFGLRIAALFLCAGSLSVHDLIQTLLQGIQRHLLVLPERTLLGSPDDDARGTVDRPHAVGMSISELPSRTAAAERLELNVADVDLHRSVLLVGMKV